MTEQGTIETYPGNRSIPPFSSDPTLDCIAEDEDFDGTWPFQPHFFHGNGFKQHYVEEGSENASTGTIVLLHGEPTWGYLYRNFITPLSKTHRVIVPDHMGFGKSETPPDREYCIRSHTLNLMNLLDHLNVDNVTLVIQDWGVILGTQYALRRPDKVARIFYLSIGFPRTTDENTARAGDRDKYGRQGFEKMLALRNAEPGQRWFQWIMNGLPKDPNYICPARYSDRNGRSPQGRTETVLLNSGSTVVQTMKHLVGFQSEENMTDTWCRAYSSQFPTEASAVGALNFPMEACGQLALSPEAQSFPTEKTSIEDFAKIAGKPVWLAYGKHDRAIVFNEKKAQRFRAIYGDVPIIQLENAGHFVQEDCPDVLVALIQMFIQTTGGGLFTKFQGGLNYKHRL